MSEPLRRDEGTREFETLSAAGQARRREMLGALLDVLERTKRRRRNVRWTAGAVVVALLAARIVVRPGAGEVHPRDGERVVRTEEGALRQGARRASSRASVEVVGTVSGISERWGARSGVVRVEHLDDRGLVDTLASIGRPAGLVQIEGRVMLTEAVTDRERSGGSMRPQGVPDARAF